MKDMKGMGVFLVDMMMEYAPLPIIIIDSEGKALAYNRRASSIFLEHDNLLKGSLSLFNMEGIGSERKFLSLKEESFKGLQCEVDIGGRRYSMGIYPLSRIIYIKDKFACFFEQINKNEPFLQRGRRVENIAKVLLESIGDALLVAHDATKKISYANPKAIEVLGYEEKDLLGKPIRNLHPDDELDRVFYIFERQAKGEINLAEDIPFVKKDGSVIYADINATLVMANGESYVVGILRDITYKKALLSKLLTTNRLLEAIFERTNLMFAYMGEDFKIIRVNENFAQVLGPDIEQFVGRNFFDIFPEEELKAVFEEVVIMKRFVAMQEFPFTRSDDKIVYVDFMLSPMDEEPDGIKGLIFSGTDVTEFVKTKEELHEVEYIKNTVLHGLNELVVYLTPDFVIRWANKPYLEASQYKDFQEIIGKKCYFVLDSNTKICSGCPVSKTLKDLKPYTSYVRFKNGREFYVRAFPDTDDDRVKGVVVACLEVTELKIREHSIKRLNSMLNVMKEVSQSIIRNETAEGVLENVTAILSSKEDYRFAFIILTDRMGVPVLFRMGPKKESSALLSVIKDMEQGKISECMEKAFVESGPVIIKSENCKGCKLKSECKKSEHIFVKKLEHKGHVMGVIGICVNGRSPEGDEISLFRELSDDLAYALYYMMT